MYRMIERTWTFIEYAAFETEPMWKYKNTYKHIQWRLPAFTYFQLRQQASKIDKFCNKFQSVWGEERWEKDENQMRGENTSREFRSVWKKCKDKEVSLITSRPKDFDRNVRAWGFRLLDLSYSSLMLLFLVTTHDRYIATCDEFMWMLSNPPNILFTHFPLMFWKILPCDKFSTL